MVVAASDFRARCLSIIDEVGETGESVVISRHGGPVARLIRYVDSEGECPQRELLGSVVAAGDFTSPLIPADAWESARPPASAARTGSATSAWTATRLAMRTSSSSD